MKVAIIYGHVLGSRRMIRPILPTIFLPKVKNAAHV